MNRSGVLALSIVVILAPLIIADSRVRVKRQTNEAVVDSIFNIPITAIRQTSEAVRLFSPENSRAIATIFKIPVSTLEAVSNLVKQTSSRRRVEEGQNLQRLRRETVDGYVEEEGRTLHHIKKKKHKFQHYQKPSHYGYFGQPILFPGHYHKPPAWKPTHAIPQFVNIFNQENHGNYGYHKPHHKPHHKPQSSHSPGHYQVWEDIQEEWPNPWSGGFLGLGPQYPTGFQNKVAPRSGREYRSYTTPPKIYGREVDEVSNEDSKQDDSNLVNKNRVVFKN